MFEVINNIHIRIRDILKSLSLKPAVFWP